jgi:hypothetical protein
VPQAEAVVTGNTHEATPSGDKVASFVQGEVADDVEAKEMHQIVCDGRDAGAEGDVGTTQLARESARGSQVSRVHRRKFTPEEDAVLLRCRDEGKSWTEIAKSLPGREGSTVRKRCELLDKKQHAEPSSAAVAPSQEGLIQQVQRIKKALELGQDLTLPSAIKAANEAMGLEPAGSLPQQAANLLRALGIGI